MRKPELRSTYAFQRRFRGDGSRLGWEPGSKQVAVADIVLQSRRAVKSSCDTLWLRPGRARYILLSRGLSRTLNSDWRRSVDRFESQRLDWRAIVGYHTVPGNELQLQVAARLKRERAKMETVWDVGGTRERVEAGGLRVTAQRLLVLQSLEGTG